MATPAPVLPPQPIMAPPPKPASDRLAGKTNLASPTPEQMAREVQTEVNSLKQLIEGFAREYPQAQQATEMALEAIAAMGDSVLATLEPPLGNTIEPPPSV